MLQTVFLLNTDVITFVEYYQGDKYMNVKPNNGKDINSIGPNKKHLNSVPKEYQHKSPHVNNLISGSAHQILLMGDQLGAVLNDYDMKFQDGSQKSLGNSKVQVRMYTDAEGNSCGMLNKVQ
tara:strand:- start:766 stop:1131 length:366 start_codon:yes stop_codon:yes gene_type:complete